jgi:hypothetical protein
MNPTVVALPTLEELFHFVHEKLCQQDALDPSQTPLIRTPLMRRRRPCGLLFQVEGPRLLRTAAIWAAEQNRLLFYDSTGQRFDEVRLSESPELRLSNNRSVA